VTNQIWRRGNVQIIVYGFEYPVGFMFICSGYVQIILCDSFKIYLIGKG